ncbi:nitrilase-related carbon-nitrogen hydrolase [Thermoproteota archaeon]
MSDSNGIFGNKSSINVACCQIEPKIGDTDVNIENTLSWIEKAASVGSKLIILPELCVSGYVFNTRNEAFQNAEKVPGGRSIKSWEEVANQNDVYLVAGVAEVQNSILYNTSVLIGPSGYIGKYRKLHLWFEEKLFFEQGDMGLPLFKLPFGRLAMMVCYDMWFPEVARIYASMGADIITIPTNWPKKRTELTDITDNLIISQSHMNGVFIAASDRVGYERGIRFHGRSIITSNRGVVLGGPASETSEELIIAKCNLSDSRVKQSNRLNNIFGDRRGDIYDLTLGYRGQ